MISRLTKGSSLLFLVILFSCNNDDKRLFHLIDPAASGITFNNAIRINDSINILDNEFTYNGAGVAIGDLNGDGLQDIYFCGNQVPNQCYLNKGGLQFENITEAAGVQKKTGQWSSGVTLVDINRDGRQDIYVCNTMIQDPLQLRDLLFINQGNDAKGIPHFKEMGTAYGITDDNHNSISTFFDYDNDGDLDLFVAVNFIDVQYPNQFITRLPDGKSPTRDLLFRNDWDSTLGHPVFTDVSLKAGIIWGGYSHSCLIHDFNEDGYSDIYVANDYLSNDLLYINNHNGTFTNKIADIFKHQSYSSMGSDIADVNNDGHPDLFTVEMLPKDNKRKKVNMNANNYNHYLFTEQYQYEYEFVRNTFQLYQGISPITKLPIYSDIAFLAGVEATDWSWSPLLADFDNDGYRDLLVTNGFPRDITDHDFGAFRNSINSSLVTRNELMNMIPEVKIPNFIFRNNGNLVFQDKSQEWGIDQKSFTNGTAYADLDNDGDLDILTNNIGDPAFLFENRLYVSDSKKRQESAPHFLRIRLDGPVDNQQGFGAIISIHSGKKLQVAESECVRGYLSRSEAFIHFGLGKDSVVDILEVNWPDGRKQQLHHIKADEVFTVRYKDAQPSAKIVNQTAAPLLQPEDPAQFGIDYIHQENDFIDFNFQKTLPHKFSQYGPALAISDVNGDGTDDMILGGSSRFQGPVVLLQSSSGRFNSKTLPIKVGEQMKEEDMGLLLFDADADGDNDLYIVRGSYQHDAQSPLYQDVLCENDGKGNFTVVKEALPSITASGQNVKAADMDNDGDLDLFIGGRVAPKAYPLPGESLLLRNDSKLGKILFTDVTDQWYKPLRHIGMVSDALWTDFDTDGKPDLLIAGEWMPLTFLRNTGSGLAPYSAGDDVASAMGWWNSLAASDLDLDGDLDYIAGNFGMNQYFKCSSSEPLRIYGKDFDQNGSYDSFISCYFSDSTGRKQEYFFHSKDDMQKQLILIRRKFEKYADFGRATVKQVFTPEEMKGSMVLKANYMKSVWLENKGKEGFVVHALPVEAQFAPIYGIQAMDMNGDAYPEIALVGNDFGMETSQGRADAFNGLILENKAGKDFNAIGFERSGFFVPGDARALALAAIGKANYLVATQNRKALSLFKVPNNNSIIELQPQEDRAMVQFTNGRKQLVEFSWGSSFLSQNTRKWAVPTQVATITIKDRQGRATRTLHP